MEKRIADSHVRSARDEAPVMRDEEHMRVRPLKCANVSKLYGLTARETDVLEQLSKGSSTRAVATRLSISEQTVKTHTRHIFNKLGIHKRQELIDIVENMPKFL